MWNSGDVARTTSSLVGTGSPAAGTVPPMATAPRASLKVLSWTKPTTDRWVAVTALGRPVVPLVKIRAAGSSSDRRHRVGLGAGVGLEEGGQVGLHGDDRDPEVEPRHALHPPASATITDGSARATAWAISSVVQ